MARRTRLLWAIILGILGYVLVLLVAGVIGASTQPSPPGSPFVITPANPF